MQGGQWRDNGANLPGISRTNTPPANSRIWSGPVEAGDRAAASSRIWSGPAEAGDGAAASSRIWSGPVEAGDGAAASNRKVREALENLDAAPMVLMRSLLMLLSCTAMRRTWRALRVQLIGTVERNCDGV